MNKVKALAGETVLYGLGSILPRLINFFLIIPQTDVFSPEEYGIITDLYAWVAFLNILCMFGMETTYFRFSTKPEVDRQRIFNMSQTAVMLITGLLTTMFIVFSTSIAKGFHIEGHGNYIIWLALVIAIDATVAIPFAKLRMEKKAIRFAIAKIINVLIIVGLNVLFFQAARHSLYDEAIGVGYVILFNLIGNAFYLVYFSKTLLQWKPQLDKNILSDMLKYAYPIMLTGIAGMTNEMFSRITLRTWLPENFYPGKSADYALGIFGACYKYAMFMNLAIQSFRFAAEPFFFSNSSDKNSRQLFAQVNHYFVIVCCILLLAVSLNLDILQYILRDASYRVGLDIVPVLLIGYMFLGIYYNFTVWFKLTDKTYFGTLITVGGAVVTILANYFLIPVGGYMGSSWATLICYFSMMATCYWLGQKYYPIPYRIGKDSLYVLATVALMYLVDLITFGDIWIGFVSQNGILLIFIGIVFWLEKSSLNLITRKT